MGLSTGLLEGYDQIPQRILIDGCDSLTEPLFNLFELIYRDGLVPEQRLISKIIPVHKKGDKSMIENYRPVANLCCVSKLFNESFNSLEFTLLNFNQLLTGRQTLFKTLKSNCYKVGLNSLSNRLYFLNDKIPLEWLNNSFSTFKIKCKKMFLDV